MSPEEIEHEVEHHRSNVEGTLDALKERMSFRQLANEVQHYFSADDAKAAMDSVAGHVRANPMALALIAAGLGWLAFGGRSNGHHHYDDRYGRRDDDWDAGGREAFGAPGSYAGGRSAYPAGGYGSTSYSTGSYGTRGYGTAGGASDERRGNGEPSTMEKVSERVSSLASDTADAASRVYEKGRRSVQDLGTRAGEAAHSARDRVSATGSNWRPGSGYGSSASSMVDTIRREPILVGAAALGFGITLGLVLRSTHAEDRWMGPAHDRAMEGARNAAEAAKERGAEALRAASSAAVDAAEEEGLLPGKDGKTIAEKVEHVASAAAHEAREHLEGGEKKTGSSASSGSSASAGATSGGQASSAAGSSGSTTGSRPGTTGI
jgi:ElaB/YqjD/DUF883 family membrane-anchored ribosome-binding protein